MGIAERKAKQRKELRDAVLAAAEDLFAHEGYENVSMRKIARSIEYSPTTIYRLFDDKADLMAQVIAKGYEGVYRRYREVQAARFDSPFEALRAIIRVYVDFALENSNHYQFWFASSEIELREGLLYMKHGDTVYQVYSFWLEKIDECLEQGLFKGKDRRTAFQLIWSAVHGLISIRIQHPKFSWIPVHDHVEELLTILERGFARVEGD